VTANRTLAPLGRREAPVTGVERVGAYELITVADPEGPADPRPGQFYMLAAAEGWGAGADERPFLPRAFSFLRARRGELQFLLEDVGPGTHRLGALRAGEGLLLLGPLGLGFTAAADGTRPLLVGGGIGIAPLAAWQDELKRGQTPFMLAGFRDAAHAEGARLLEGARVATDDGSVGHAGLVTDLLAEELDGDDAATVYACGPPPMLEAVRHMCETRGVAAQLALEAGMACGYGACFGCAIPTRHGYHRICVDGPVLDAALLESALIPGTGH
jgi:dihydroorotate dehydrogenase electron transfer subunit